MIPHAPLNVKNQSGRGVTPQFLNSSRSGTDCSPRPPFPRASPFLGIGIGIGVGNRDRESESGVGIGSRNRESESGIDFLARRYRYRFPTPIPIPMPTGPEVAHHFFGIGGKSYLSLQNCLQSGSWHGRPDLPHGRDGRATSSTTIDISSSSPGGQAARWASAPYQNGRRRRVGTAGPAVRTCVYFLG
jgi:hypothetical protein